jgi:hypothetical protein
MLSAADSLIAIATPQCLRGRLALLVMTLERNYDL